MAEPKKPVPKQTQTPKPASKTTSQNSKSIGDIQEIFTTIRNSFIDTMKKLSSYQKDFEKIISDYQGRGVKYQNDISGLMEKWYEGLTKLQEEFSSLAKETLNAYMPNNFNLPFAVEFEKLSSQMQDMYKKFFSAFPVFNK